MMDSDKLDALMILAGNVAHELNNIFTAINGNLSLLEPASEDVNLNAQVINDVLNTTRRGLELSEKLQAFAGRQKLLRARLDLHEVVVATVKGMTRSILHGIDTRIAVAQENCVVVTDEEKLRDVIEELARNAVAAMDRRGKLVVSTGRERIGAERADILPMGDYAFVRMKDVGCGMSPDVARRALDPLFSTKPGYHGWGLAWCAGFVRQCGGDIVLNSVLGQGTIVTVYLPLVT